MISSTCRREIALKDRGNVSKHSSSNPVLSKLLNSSQAITLPSMISIQRSSNFLYNRLQPYDKGKEKATKGIKSKMISSASLPSITHKAQSSLSSLGTTKRPIVFDSDDEVEVLDHVALPKSYKKPRTELGAQDNPYPTPESLRQSTPPRFKSTSSSSTSTSRQPLTLTPSPSKTVSYKSAATVSYPSLPSSHQPPDNALFSQFDYGVKNTGLRASRDIPRGSLIIKEAPFFVVPDVEDMSIEDISEAVQGLTKYFKGVFGSFTTRQDEGAETDLWVNIVETNGIPLGEISSEGILGLFENICRVNHSCSPNAGWRWDESLQAMHLYAYKNIRMGEEITCSYLDDDELLSTFRSRNDRLLRYYGFTCVCSACTKCRNSLQHLQESDGKLEKFAALKEEWDVEDPLDFAQDVDEALDTLEEAMSILKTERKIHAQGQVLEQVFMIYAAYGMNGEARNAARQVTDHYAAILGREVAESLEYARWARDPTLYPDWNDLAYRKKKKRKVGTRSGTKDKTYFDCWGNSDDDYVDI